MTKLRITTITLAQRHLYF